MKGLFMVPMFSAFTASCATRYGATGLMGGFSETPLESDTYRLRANGNRFTQQRKTNAMALVKAAELAVEHGYDRFAVLDYAEWTKTSDFTTPTTAATDSAARTNLYANGSGYDVGQHTYISAYGRAHSRTTSTTTIHPGKTYAIEKPQTDLVLLFVPSNAPESTRALRVADIIARYGKLAGDKAKEAASPALAGTLTTTQPMPSALSQVTPVIAENVEQQAGAAPVEPPQTLTPVQASVNRNLPTLDDVYKSLFAGEKARLNRLPPAQRADYLEQAREHRF